MELRRAAIARITANSVFAFSIFLVALASIFFAEGSHVQAATPPFSKNYQLNDRSEHIRSLQRLPNAQGFVIAQSGAGSIGNETPLFGLHTYQALKTFQSTRGLPSTGYLGPPTRAFINAGYSTATQTSSQNISPITSSATTTTSSTTPPSSTPLPGYAPGQIIFIGGSSPAPLSAADPPCPSRSHLPERLFPAHLSR
jgi:peptidoglycan hydrolase-like protein with peptidoglycan-binding domain